MFKSDDGLPLLRSNANPPPVMSTPLSTLTAPFKRVDPSRTDSSTMHAMHYRSLSRMNSFLVHLHHFHCTMGHHPISNLVQRMDGFKASGGFVLCSNR
mmetsp:Transcript_32553/g.39397  ORF Transcript_32553/g.39397 Transcript_32553/m.39397 type:complete len:98 (-) Transcript_32553:1431-1724(-)